MQKIKIGFLALLTAFSITALASETPRWGVDVNLCSYHIGRQDKGLNQWNPGIGVTYHFSDQFSASVGEYYNSYRFTTVYGMVDYRPFGWKGVSGGLFGGFYTNYGDKQQGVFGAGLSLEARPCKHLALDVRYVPPFKHGLGNVLGLSGKVLF